MLLRKIFSRRKHQRFLVEEKTYLVFQPNTSNEKKLQILDISEGGCGFIYQGDEKDLENMSFVTLTNDGIPYMERIKISKVNDNPTSGPYRRRGVEFKWLGTFDKEKLKRFIQTVSISEV